MLLSQSKGLDGTRTALNWPKPQILKLYTLTSVQSLLADPNCSVSSAEWLPDLRDKKPFKPAPPCCCWTPQLAGSRPRVHRMWC